MHERLRVPFTTAPSTHIFKLELCSFQLHATQKTSFHSSLTEGPDQPQGAQVHSATGRETVHAKFACQL